MINKFFLCSLVAAFIMPATASATVIGGQVTGGNSGGSFQILNPPPAAVGDDNQQSPDLFAFNEDQNINILAPISVNIGADPQVGDVVASHYIFFDPDSLQTMMGYIDFDADVFGIITTTALLAASDFLINNSVTYNNPGLRGLENNDSTWIDTNLAYRVHVDFSAGTPGDYIRVLTMRSPHADVPEPSIFGLLGLGLFGVFALRRRKNHLI